MSRITCALLLATFSFNCTTDAQDSDEGPGGWGGKADDPTTGSFLASLPGWGRYIVLDQLDEIVPVYLAETRSVLARIDALPGTIAETTALDDVPIPDLFANGQTALLEVLSDADFAGGRTEHDIAWLRQSAIELETLRQDVVQLIADGTSPSSFDVHLTNEAYWTGPNGVLEINVGLAAVSRFYCNLDVRIMNTEQGFSVEANESCD
jgi:hypothetical protein